jgi:hypothetical protein
MAILRMTSYLPSIVPLGRSKTFGCAAALFTRINGTIDDDVAKTYTRAPLVLAVALAACGRKHEATPARGVAVEVFTDETSRTVIVDHATPLSELVGPAPDAWLEVRADTADGRFLELASPARSYPGDEIRLYLDHARPALGAFPPVTADMPPDVRRRASQPVASIVGITSVHVSTHEAPLPALTITVGGRDVALASAALRGLRNVGERRAEGWSLSEVIALAGPAPAGPVRILGAEEITLEAGDVARAVIKPNQRGEYVVRVWDDGAKAPTREVRGVRKIVLGGS